MGMSRAMSLISKRSGENASVHSDITAYLGALNPALTEALNVLAIRGLDEHEDLPSKSSSSRKILITNKPNPIELLIFKSRSINASYCVASYLQILGL